MNDALGMEPMDNNRYIVNDDGGVERADRNAGHPGGLAVALAQCLEYAALVGAQSAATLQHKDTVFVRGARSRLGRP